MSAGTIAGIVIAVVIVVALIALASLAARRRRLRQRFGPEYDRVIEGSDSRLKAESELASREKRIRHLDIRPLDPAKQAAYQAQWTAIQQQFVDDPGETIRRAQTLITAVMAERGYPTEDEDQIVEDLSVDHAATIGRFRTAQGIAARSADGTASTEDMRQAMIHYRTLFEDLLGDPAETPHDATEPVPVTDAPAPGTTGPGSVVTEDVVTEDSVAGYDAPRQPGAASVDDSRQEMIVNDSSPGDIPAVDETRPDEPPLDETRPDEPDLDERAEPAAASRRPWRR